MLPALQASVRRWPEDVPHDAFVAIWQRATTFDATRGAGRGWHKATGLQAWWNTSRSDTAWPGPVSLGLVTPGKTLQLPIEQLPSLEENQLFELTLEPAKGLPVDRPTGPIQFIGRAVKVM